MSDRGNTSFVRNQLPAIFWAILIFFLSSIPGDLIPLPNINQFDKILHLIIFFFFGLLIYRAFNLFWTATSFSLSRAIFTLLTVTVYGILDEIHQKFVPGRTPDIWDATADTTGGILAILLIYFVMLRKDRRNKSGV